MLLTPGPFVAMAVLCQRYDRQPDGTVDVTGIVDGIGLSVSSAEELLHHPATLQLMALVALRAGDCRGQATVRVKGRFPSGLPGASVTHRVQFTDERPGASLRVPLELCIQEAGTYWFDVEVDDRLLTSISFVADVHYDGS